MEDELFEEKDYTKVSFNGSHFSYCTFKECLFIGSLLRNTQFSCCKFINCNLSLVETDMCRFQEVQFDGCKMVGVKFYLCDKRFFSIEARNCVVKSCNFSDLKMKNVPFTGSEISDCDFKEVELMGADFSGCNLKNTLFHNCNLSKADFRNAEEYEIDPETNKITQAKFSLPEALTLLKGFDISINE